MGKSAHRGGNWRINNYGWNSEIDYSETKDNRPLVAVIGDSYVQAFEVNVEDNFSSVLERTAGPGIRVYSFGISGAPLSQYLQISRYVRKHFHPDVLVICVVHNDFAESLLEFSENPHFLHLRPTGSGFEEVQPIPYVPNRFRRFWKQSALAAYFYENLHFYQWWTARKIAAQTKMYEENVDVHLVNRERETIEKATLLLVKKIREENPQTPILFMIDGLRSEIYSARPGTSSFSWMNVIMEKAATENGCYFLDLTETFRESFHKDHQEFNPEYDWHWNKYGHEVVGRELYRSLIALNILKVQPTGAVATR
jgi:lysophospholipase L1-like esterase